jgi:uncharacterized protein YqjF (DUF2071 family)
MGGEMAGERPYSIAMRWHDLLFMHWPIPPNVLRPLIPPGLTVDTYEGEAWIAIVPFHMTGIRPRLLPAMPWVSAFAELNVRTYVTAGGIPGVWFFSLDAANPLAVRVARRTFHLAYYDARMSVEKHEDELAYSSTRTHRNAPAAVFSARYRPTDEVSHSLDGTLAAFFTERYSLYAADKRNTIYRGDIRHVRWPLRNADAEVEQNTMTEPLGIRLPDVKPILHYAERLDVEAWTIRPVVPA